MTMLLYELAKSIDKYFHYQRARHIRQWKDSHLCLALPDLKTYFDEIIEPQQSYI